MTLHVWVAKHKLKSDICNICHKNKDFTRKFKFVKNKLIFIEEESHDGIELEIREHTDADYYSEECPFCSGQDIRRHIYKMREIQDPRVSSEIYLATILSEDNYEILLSISIFS